MKRLGYVKRKANTKFKVEVEEFEAMKAQFLYEIEVIIELEEVPDDLIINWDHTGINYVPTSNWTMVEEGSNRVEIVGLGDKRQITIVLSRSLKCFENRYENGYDLTDDLKYNKWKDQFHPEGTVNCLTLSMILSI